MTTGQASSTTKTEPAANPCEVCAMRSHCMSAGLNAADLAKFRQAARIRIVRPGEFLFHAGTAFHSLYLVRSGTVKATAAVTDGTEQISGFYLPGELLGLDGIETGHHINTAEALETSSICVLPFAALLELARNMDSLQLQLWHYASHEITFRQRLLMSVGRRSAEGRVAEFLLSISARFKRFGYSETRFRLPMSRQDIAAYLGLSVETVCRVLTRFQETGLLRRDQREIELNDLEGLAELCVGCPDSLADFGESQHAAHRSGPRAAAG